MDAHLAIMRDLEARAQKLKAKIQQLNDQISWHRDEVKRLQPLRQEPDSAGKALAEIQEEADAIGLMNKG